MLCKLFCAFKIISKLHDLSGVDSFLLLNTNTAIICTYLTVLASSYMCII